LKAVNTALEHTSIPTNVTAILSDPKCVTLTSTSDDFWILARALKDFVDARGERRSLPLRGSIPDMFSDSKRYIQLQNIYRERANADAEEVFNRVQHHLEAIGRQPVSCYT
jgi:amyloid beta precursor protein binding protein 1